MRTSQQEPLIHHERGRMQGWRRSRSSSVHAGWGWGWGGVGVEKQMAKEPMTISPPPGLRLWAGRQRNANCARSERQSLHLPVSLLPGTPCLLQDGMHVSRARSPVLPQNARLIGARLCTDICPRLISRKRSFKKRNAHNCDFSRGSHRGTCVKVQNALEKDARCKSTVLGGCG